RRRRASRASVHSSDPPRIESGPAPRSRRAPSPSSSSDAGQEPRGPLGPHHATPTRGSAGYAGPSPSRGSLGDPSRPPRTRQAFPRDGPATPGRLRAGGLGGPVEAPHSIRSYTPRSESSSPARGSR